MEATVLVAPPVVKELQRFERVALFTDRRVEDELANRKLLQEKFGNATIPTYYLLDGAGNVVASQIGPTDEAGFLAFLAKAR